MDEQSKWTLLCSQLKVFHRLETAMELEEKVRILKEQFSSLPGILIKKTLCSDDINEDLKKCKQRLQEFNKQINNPSLRSTSVGTTTGLHDPSQEGCVSTDKAEDLSENGLENRNVKGKHSTPKRGTVNLKR